MISIFHKGRGLFLIGHTGWRKIALHDELVEKEVRLMTQRRWPIVKEGLPFLIPFVLFTVFFAGMEWKVLTFLGILFSLFIAFFFRNPKRKIPNLQNIILAPADGRIIHVGECEEDCFLKTKALKVSIFMSFFNVHLNRAPVSGKVIQRSYHPGRFLVAYAEKSSLLNEQNAFILEAEDRFKILLIQIAGFVARRIICYVKAGDTFKKGRNLWPDPFWIESRPLPPHRS